MFTISVILVTLMGQSSAADAGRIAEAERLGACLAKIKEDPEEAYEDALAWVGEGGRPFARACTAEALLELGHYEEAAIRLEDLANAEGSGSLSQRVVYLTKSGNAWLVAGQPEAALVTLNNALRLNPRDVNLRVDRAVALMALERWQEAEEDLSDALVSLINPGEAYRLRAETRLNLGNLDGAREDVTKAIELDIEDVDAHVLNGLIKQATWELENNPPPDRIEILE
ncbi:MAG: tetratricopeptide repeat protein [Pseudomonadota bacterium]